MDPVRPSSAIFRPSESPLGVSEQKRSTSASKIVVPDFPVSQNGNIEMPLADILAGLCARNEVTYLGDIHGQLAIPEFVSACATKLKHAGVEMAGVEFVKYRDNAAFQIALAQGEGHVKDLLNNWAQKHGYEWAGRVAKALVGLHRAGIKVVGVDVAVPGGTPNNLNEAFIYMKKRLALNTVWNKALANELSRASMNKAIMWGGASHFITGDAEGPANMRSGPIMSFVHEGEKGAPLLGQSRMNPDNRPLIVTTIPKTSGVA